MKAEQDSVPSRGDHRKPKDGQERNRGFLTGEAETKKRRDRRRRPAASLRILWKLEFPAHWEQEDHGGGHCGQMPLRAVSIEAAAFICSETM